MNYRDLQKNLYLYTPALIFDDSMVLRLPKGVRTLLFFLTAILFVLFVAGMFLPAPFVTVIAAYTHLINASFFILLSFSLALLMVGGFYNSYYFRDVISSLRESQLKNEHVPLTYLAAQIIYRTDDSDMTAGFIFSPFGQEVLFRLGFSVDEVRQFLASRKSAIAGDAMVFPDSAKVTAVLYAQALFAADKEFSQFLFARSLQEKQFIGAAEWVEGARERWKGHLRWWGKDELGRIPSIGKSWSYGQTYLLERFAKKLEFGVEPSQSGVRKEVEQLEAILSRARGSNALIVSESGSGEMDVIYGLVSMIQNGTAFPGLEGKRMFELDGNALIDAYKNKPDFEMEFTKVLNEAVSAGDVMLVFQDLPGFLHSAENIGSDIPSLLFPYLSSPAVQIIALADKTRFHQTIETNTMLMNSFEVMRVVEKDERALVMVLESEVARVERETGIFFTYPAVEAIAESAVRFFSEGVVLDKAKDLLLEIPGAVRQAGKNFVMKDDVLRLVEAKTGVPQEGTVKSEEKEKLLNLEKLLHARVVGQDEAIDSIANAMRRARAGLRNQNRPIGSFLFLGPTGVGKTETAKAFAEVFFGSTAPMLRLDMSEYSGANALTRLIGSFEGSRAGVLATMLRDQKYGVLLLDEFEKTTHEVMSLFLQILDEGFFSDMLGKKVNARNVIIIATSNAGSQEIFNLVKEGKDLAKEKSGLIDMLSQGGFFKPELINRFDGVILFHPLGQAHMEKIATLMVARLAKRLKEQGLNLNVTDDLVRFLATEGFDPKFGARPMNRVLQERVEKLLADKLIRGEIAKGATVELVASPDTPGDLEVRAMNS